MLLPLHIHQCQPRCGASPFGFVLATRPFWLIVLVPVHHYASFAVQLGTFTFYAPIIAAIPFSDGPLTLLAFDLRLRLY